MTALHAAAARPAGPNGHPERTHDYSRSRQLFLKLRRQPRRLQPASAIRTGRRQQGIVSFIHSPRLSPPRRDAIAGTRPAPWRPRVTFEGLGKRRRLTTTRPARRRQLPLQPLVLVLQPLVALVQPPVVPLQPVPFAFNPLELAAQSFRSLAPPILRLGPASCLTLHTTFMAYSLPKYNPIIWIAGPDPVTCYSSPSSPASSSLPAPPSSVSSPAPPLSTSVPASPMRSSLPAPPLSTSLPAPPETVSSPPL